MYIYIHVCTPTPCYDTRSINQACCVQFRSYKCVHTCIHMYMYMYCTCLCICTCTPFTCTCIYMYIVYTCTCTMYMCICIILHVQMYIVHVGGSTSEGIYHCTYHYSVHPPCSILGIIEFHKGKTTCACKAIIRCNMHMDLVHV